MSILYLWFFYLVIGIILLSGKAIACKLLGIYHNHYQIGYSPSLLQFKISDVRFSIGIIVPLPWLFKIYEIHEDGKRTPQPIWMRREHSFWKRLGGILGGIVLLYVVMTLLYAQNHYMQQRTYLSADNLNQNGIYVDEVGYELGFRNGDKILKIEGKTFERYTDIRKIMLLERAEKFTILRNDSMQELVIDSSKALEEIITNHAQLIYPVIAKYPIKIQSIKAYSTAYDAGIEKGDEIITLNRDTIFYFRDFINTVQGKEGNSIVLGIRKNDSQEVVTKNVTLDENGKLGIRILESTPRTNEKKSVWKSLHAGNRFIKVYLKQMGIIMGNEKAVKKTGGYATIGNVFPDTRPFLSRLSIALLVYFCLHIIPTPITDTRHLIALLIDQAIKLPKSASTWIGWSIIVPLFLIANIIDLVKLFP